MKNHFLVNCTSLKGLKPADFNGSGKGAVKAYGISLKDSPKWAELHGICTDPVIGVFAGTTRPENALKFVDYLL